MRKTGSKEWGDGIEPGSPRHVQSQVLKIINAVAQRQRKMMRKSGRTDTALSVIEEIRAQVSKIEADNSKSKETKMDEDIWRRFSGRFGIDFRGDGASA